MAFVGVLIARLAPGSLKQNLTEPVLTAHCWTKVLLDLLGPAIMSLKHVGMFL